jgi:hypothetical protein
MRSRGATYGRTNRPSFEDRRLALRSRRPGSSSPAGFTDREASQLRDSAGIGPDFAVLRSTRAPAPERAEYRHRRNTRPSARVEWV